MSITAFLKRHPVSAFFALTFVISWGGVLLVIDGIGGIPGTKEEFERLLPPAILAMLAGPSLAGILLTGLLSGRASIQDFLSRLFKWRVGVRWYAVALMGAPMLLAAVFLGLSLFPPEFLPGICVTDNKVSHLLFGLAVGLVAGIFEELGWTGFAVPALRMRFGVLATGLIVGYLWGAWHLLVAYWASGTVSGALSPTSYLLDPLLLLPVFRVLMVWVYDHTGSLLLAMLMHTSLTAGTRIFTPLAISGAHLLTFDFVWFALLWVVVAAVAVANRGRLSRSPLRI